MEKLGIEQGLLVAQIVNFSIIVLVLSKLLYKPIMAMLEKRRKEIEAGVELTEKLRQEEERLKERKQKVLDEAKKQAVAIIEAAKKQAKEEADDLVADARREVDQMIEKGKEEVLSEQKAMVQDIQKSAVELAVLMSKRLLSSILSPAQKHELIAKQLKELEKLHA